MHLCDTELYDLVKTPISALKFKMLWLLCLFFCCWDLRPSFNFSSEVYIINLARLYAHTNVEDKATYG